MSYVCRDGSDWLFDELHKHNVPLLIFSAGVGDVVMETVKQRAVLHDNVKVVSNFMDFDSQVSEHKHDICCPLPAYYMVY